jgi:hypothetical protein
MSLPEQSILVQLPHGSAQPVGTNAIGANVMTTVKTRKREVETIALPP